MLCGCEPSGAAPIAAWLDGWKLPDAIQVAAARLHALDLATRNTKDFPPRKFDFVVVPYAI